MAWTDEMVEDLKKMWKEGLTTGEIGKRLNVSKNSIVGKVHRLGLSGRPSPIKKKDEAPAPHHKAEKPAPKEHKPAEKKEPAPAKEAPAPKAAPAPKPLKVEKEKEEESFTYAPTKATKPTTPDHPVSLTELDNHTCRWPVGDPKDANFHFCGKKVRVGQTYCEEHSAVAYVKPGKK